jgi:hypothetical protein
MPLYLTWGNYSQATLIHIFIYSFIHTLFIIISTYLYLPSHYLIPVSFYHVNIYSLILIH